MTAVVAEVAVFAVAAESALPAVGALASAANFGVVTAPSLMLFVLTLFGFSLKAAYPTLPMPTNRAMQATTIAALGRGIHLLLDMSIPFDQLRVPPFQGHIS